MTAPRLDEKAVTMRNSTNRTLRASVSLAGMTIFGLAALGLVTASPLGGLGGDDSGYGAGGATSSMLGGDGDSGMHNQFGDFQVPSVKYSAYAVPMHNTCFGLGGTYRAPWGNVLQANCQQKHNSYFKGNVDGHHVNGGKDFHAGR